MDSDFPVVALLLAQNTWVTSMTCEKRRHAHKRRNEAYPVDRFGGCFGVDGLLAWPPDLDGGSLLLWFVCPVAGRDDGRRAAARSASLLDRWLLGRDRGRDGTLALIPKEAGPPSPFAGDR